MSFINELKRERNALTERLNAINLLLKSYGETEPGLTQSANKHVEVDYDLTKELKKSSTPQKFLLVLKENQRFMKIREMAKFIEAHVGGTEDNWTIKLSRTTGKLKKMNKIVSYKVGSSNTNVFWGSPNWLDNERKIKSGYEYIEDAIDKKQNITLIDI
jgi:hypothetical protein